jgi:hypothetical protein
LIIPKSVFQYTSTPHEWSGTPISHRALPMGRRTICILFIFEIRIMKNSSECSFLSICHEHKKANEGNLCVSSSLAGKETQVEWHLSFGAVRVKRFTVCVPRTFCDCVPNTSKTFITQNFNLPRSCWVSHPQHHSFKQFEQFKNLASHSSPARIFYQTSNSSFLQPSPSPGADDHQVPPC